MEEEKGKTTSLTDALEVERDRMRHVDAELQLIKANTGTVPSQEAKSLEVTSLKYHYKGPIWKDHWQTKVTLFVVVFFDTFSQNIYTINHTRYKNPL